MEISTAQIQSTWRPASKTGQSLPSPGIAFGKDVIELRGSNSSNDLFDQMRQLRAQSWGHQNQVVAFGSAGDRESQLRQLARGRLEDVQSLLTGGSRLGKLSESEWSVATEGAVNHWLQRRDAGAIDGLASWASSDKDLGPTVAQSYAKVAMQLRSRLVEPGVRADAAALAHGAVEALGGDRGRQADFLQALGRDSGKFLRTMALDDEVLKPGAFNIDARIGRDRRAQDVAELLKASKGPGSAPFVDAAAAKLPTDLVQRHAAPLAGALARQWSPQRGAFETDRLHSILKTPQGANFISHPKISDTDRAQALALLRTQPWTGKDLAETDDAWTNPKLMKEIARPQARDYLARRGDKPQVLAGTHLENTIGTSMGFTPQVPTGQPIADLEKAYREGKLSYFRESDEGEAVQRVAAGIRRVGGSSPKVTVLPIQYSSKDSGLVKLPLYRVQDARTGQDRFVDNQGRSYSDFDAWKKSNRLPPGNMTYPKNGHLRSSGDVLLESENTPHTVDTLGEKAAQTVDRLALVGGIVASGVILAGTGGTGAPAVLAVSSGWGALRSGQELQDRHRHGQTLDPRKSAQARAAWLDLGGNVLGATGLGANALARRLRAGGKALDPLAATAASALHVTGTGFDALATADTGRTLLKDWDKLSPGQRAQMGLSMSFWGLSSMARTKDTGAAATDLFDPSAMRRHLLGEGKSVRPTPKTDTGLRGIDADLRVKSLKKDIESWRAAAPPLRHLNKTRERVVASLQDLKSDLSLLRDVKRHDPKNPAADQLLEKAQSIQARLNRMTGQAKQLSHFKRRLTPQQKEKMKALRNEYSEEMRRLRRDLDSYNDTFLSAVPKMMPPARYQLLDSPRGFQHDPRAEIRQAAQTHDLPPTNRPNIAYMEVAGPDRRLLHRGASISGDVEHRTLEGDGHYSHEARLVRAPGHKQSHRKHDSEVKLLEEARQALKKSQGVGRIRILTELPPCPSCQRVMLRFLMDHPGAKLEVSHLEK